MLIFLWALLSIAIAVTWDLVSFSLGRTGWKRFISSFLLFYAQIIMTQFALGLVYGLNAPFLALLNVIVTGLIIFIIVRKKGSQQLGRYWTAVKTGVKRFKKEVAKDRLWLVLATVTSVLLLWIVFIGLIFPSIDFDGNSYHLPVIGYAIQNQTFFDVPTSLGWLTGYPKGGEFIEMWTVMITHNDFLADLAQVPFLLLGMVAIYTISVRVGVDKKHARFTALLFLFLPIVLNQLKTTYIDVMLCSLFFAGIAQVLQKKLGKLDLVIVGIIFSLIISLKVTGFLFVAAITPLLIWNLYTNRDKSKKTFISNYIKPLLLVFVPTLFGFYWYVKNAVLYGNPLYPFGLKLGGVSIFPGRTFEDAAATAIGALKNLPSGCVERIWYVWTEQKDWYGCLYNYDANFSGLGPIWFALLIPAIIISIYFVIKKKNYLYGALILLVTALFVVYPLNYYSRYTLFISLIGLVSLGLVLTNVRKRVATIAKIVAIILAIFVFATNYALCNYPPETIRGQIHTVIHGDDRGDAYKSAIGNAYIVLQDTIKPGEVVAYDSSPYFIYALWKKDYSNKVTYIPAQTEQQWLDGAKQQNVRYVFTTIGSKESGWLKDDNVTSIYKDTMYEIYKLY